MGPAATTTGQPIVGVGRPWGVRRGRKETAMTTRRTTRSRLAVRSLVVAVAAGVFPVAAATAPAEAAPYCGIRWGSLPKSVSTMVRGPVTNVRAGQHTCYDRLVVDL